MKKNRFMLVFTFLLAIALIGTGCSSSDTETTNEKESSENAEVVEFNFWAAPNPTQQAYWTDMANAYMKENPNVKINVSPMPESPSSEAGIQSALAAGNAPTISENINRSFGAQLAESKAIVPLNEFEGYDELIESRNMNKTITGWEFADGNQYVLPIYSNAMLFAWNIEMLNDLGYQEPPKTYSEVIEVGKKLKEQDPEKFVWARADLSKPTWWARWFDFFMIYNAASDGNSFVQGNELVADDEAGIKTLQFFDDLSENDLLLTREATDPFETGTSLMTDIGPWTFPYWEEKFPDFKYNEDFVLSMPPVPDDVDPKDSKTFSDTKGLVIYSQSSKEQQQAAFDFIKWVYSDPANDLTWFKQTNLPPARDDLSTNEQFSSYFEDRPQLKMYAENIPNAIPAIDNENTVEIQELIGKEALNPVVKQEKEPEAAWNDMKEAINGVLK